MPSKRPSRKKPTSYRRLMDARRNAFRSAVRDADHAMVWCQTSPRLGAWFRVSKAQVGQYAKQCRELGELVWRLERHGDRSYIMLGGGDEPP